jgi:phage terminase small subunit
MEEKKTKKEIIKSLSSKQKAFCDELMIDLNQTQAAIRAGYSEKTADQQASRLLTNVKVEAYISLLKEERAEKVGATAENVLKHLNILRLARIDDYVEIKTIETIEEVAVVKKSKKEEEEDSVEMKKVIKHVQTIQFKDFKDLTEEQLMCVESVKMVKGQIELKLHGKSWTIDQINKHIGFYEKDNKLTLTDKTPPKIVFEDMHGEE